ncbi:DUF1129 domain-containing protein [Streptococcus oricebi]|uniref:DUF1129 domain-containing protein n=1 Tax=Streptococcus oricebi TaxID=1547447 RepID=A0ABS5B695_9STRE|nr:DUF1129 family protein [Streptococcus oricebi]MBP2623988.1 DUF1129 domain-containing protein [Streptococcus oricebi]
MSHLSLDQLSKKNQEFIRIATHQLIKDGKTDEEVKALLEDIIPEILENQPKGITARSLYGAPSSWASNLTKSQEEAAKHPKENDKPLVMWADASLFVLGFFAAINGATGFSSNAPAVYGLTTLIVASLTGGLAFYAMYHYVYRFYGADQKSSKRPPLLKSFLVIGAATLLWAASFSLTMFLPPVLNLRLPNLVVLIIGLIALALHFYLKKKYNIKSTMQSAPRR